MTRKRVLILCTGNRSKNVSEFDGQPFDYVITVCDNARETCPVFFGPAQMLHHNFDDPAAAEGSEKCAWLFSGACGIS